MGFLFIRINRKTELTLNTTQLTSNSITPSLQPSNYRYPKYSNWSTKIYREKENIRWKGEKILRLDRRSIFCEVWWMWRPILEAFLLNSDRSGVTATVSFDCDGRGATAFPPILLNVCDKETNSEVRSRNCEAPATAMKMKVRWYTKLVWGNCWNQLEKARVT